MRRTIATAGLFLAVLTLGCGDRSPVSNSSNRWPEELVTGTWTLEAYAWNWYRGVLDGSEVTIEFSTEDVPTVRGRAGCNWYGARFTATEDRLEIGPIGGTQMLCLEPEEVMDQESRYLSALRSVVRFRIRGDRLLMYDESGRLVLAFSKA
jgi:heat shock protein HslJ